MGIKFSTLTLVYRANNHSLNNFSTQARVPNAWNVKHIATRK